MLVASKRAVTFGGVEVIGNSTDRCSERSACSIEVKSGFHRNSHSVSDMVDVLDCSPSRSGQEATTVICRTFWPRERHSENCWICPVDSWIPSGTVTSPLNSKLSQGLTAYLPQTLVTSDLGSWHHKYQLRFDYFLPGDPSIAVFSESQTSLGPTVWRNEQPWYRRTVNVRCRWYERKLQFRPLCTVEVIVGSRWQYRVSMRSIRHWDPAARVLLLDWRTLYEEYFELEGRLCNKKRVHEIVKRFIRLEQKTLITETGAWWSSYGDWGLQQPTAADVALACRYEGRGFEEGLSPLKQRLSAHELQVRLRNLGLVMKEILVKHVALRS